jgi:SAM-dependent methyltransferase
MFPTDNLPDDYLQLIRSLEEFYLQSDDPIQQSGFGGGAERWREEREPILNAVQASGDFLDLSCANGYLLECLMAWAAPRNIQLIPYGVDLGPRLIALARRRLPGFADHFFVANAWDWQPPRQFQYVYTLHDNVPEAYLTRYVQRLYDKVIAPGGRLILGAYGSRSRQLQPKDVEACLKQMGFSIVGTAWGGNPRMAQFAWVDK